MNQIYDKIELGEMVKLRKLDQHNVPILPKQATCTNDVNPYEKALLSDRKYEEREQFTDRTMVNIK